MLKPDADWWKTLFDDIYLITDSRSVCDDKLTCKEVDIIEQLLGLERGWDIVDLCGGEGRHALELCRRGFEKVVVVDYSDFLLERGSKIAESEGLKVRFVKSDARNTDFQAGSFQAALVMANSFGYFEDPLDDRRILEEAYRLLAPGGYLLLDLVDSDFFKENFTPFSWHEVDNGVMVVCRSRELNGNVVTSRELVLSKETGLVRDHTYCIRLYSQETITALLSDVGFTPVSVGKGIFDRDEIGDYGFLTNRLIVIGRK